MSSPRERETRDTCRIVEEMKERDMGERKMNESEGTEEIKTFSLIPLPAARTAGFVHL